jgi:hypothetical protein
MQTMNSVTPPEWQLEKATETLANKTLTGQPHENFYQLGQHDARGFENLTHHLKKILHIPGGVVDPLSDAVLEGLGARLLSRRGFYRDWFEAYAEGLGLRPAELMGLCLIPELASCTNKFLPGALPLWGCSSLFARDPESTEIWHGRVLDFPLTGTYDSQERELNYHFQNFPRVWSLGTTGLPYPSLTGMNAEGVSLALHQKFNHHFSTDGHPIMEIATRLLFEGHSKRSVIKILQESKSLTLWGLYIGLPHGEVMEVDICGSELQIKEYQPEPGEMLYFNNFPLKKVEEKDLATPQGMHFQNQMRQEIAERKITRLQSTLADRQKPLRPLDLLKVLSQPLRQKGSGKEWKMDPLTPTSLQIAVMNPTQGNVLLNPGPAPKILRSKALRIHNLWDRSEHEWLRTERRVQGNLHFKALWHFSQAISQWDLGETTYALHHIQMCIEFWKDKPEEAVAQFYLGVYQYIMTNHKRERAHLLRHFELWEDKLPPYLQEHALLFIFRLEKMLRSNSRITEEHFKLVRFQRLWRFESKLPSMALSLARKAMVVRPDVLDVIYAYNG